MTFPQGRGRHLGGERINSCLSLPYGYSTHMSTNPIDRPVVRLVQDTPSPPPQDYEAAALSDPSIQKAEETARGLLRDFDAAVFRGAARLFRDKFESTALDIAQEALRKTIPPHTLFSFVNETSEVPRNLTLDRYDGPAEGPKNIKGLCMYAITDKTKVGSDFYEDGVLCRIYLARSRKDRDTIVPIVVPLCPEGVAIKAEFDSIVAKHNGGKSPLDLTRPVWQSFYDNHTRSIYKAGILLALGGGVTAAAKEFVVDPIRVENAERDAKQRELSRLEQQRRNEVNGVRIDQLSRKLQDLDNPALSPADRGQVINSLPKELISAPFERLRYYGFDEHLHKTVNGPVFPRESDRLEAVQLLSKIAQND